MEKLSSSLEASAAKGELLKPEQPWIQQSLSPVSPQAKEAASIAMKLADRAEENGQFRDEAATWLSRGAVRSGISSPGAQTPQQLAATLRQQIRLYVFVSLGMPETVLKSYFLEAASRPDVVLVFRGWTPPHYREQVAAIAKLMPEGKRVNVIIDPTLFRAYQVDAVPVHLVLTAKGVWKKAGGAVSISAAKDALERGQNRQQLGSQYQIKEPDILQILQARTAEFDWDGAREGAMKRVDARLPSVDLPVADANRTYLVDPTVTLARDIRMDSGELVAAAGSKVNSLRSLPLLRPIYVFDPGQIRQLDWVKARLQERDGLVLATRLPRPENGVSLADQVGSSLFPLNSQLVKRLALQATPSRIVQLGDWLEVTVYDLRASP
ncbi:TrbC family F-type conjugative pilus assembly protein [Chromobacterium sp. IIBBL 290-4]|uniref:TrbC family F-type conjugative pilus assembly protein n=1 Tax=Chromobacterium sp. IIBBL 290-4 TaxID=2953890 RepID=UPI0020B75447|nr:TrbC family F-type conjugative pilus assembly protein [Chromobacterium sp. IIBBL 290-4]UTH74234.1 TrbC family F-type conjugative pilus assembly protein [Chromobacterium sp. IIBBL 290-4]